MDKFFLFQEIIKDRPVAYHPDFAKAIGSVQAALFLSQLLYWSDKGNNDGWIYKTQKEFYEETGLSRREQETARRKLKELGILEEKYQGIPRKLYYRVNMNRLVELMFNYYDANNNAQIRHYGMADSDKQGCAVPPSKLGGIQQSNTEITTENTTETTTEIEDISPSPAEEKVQLKKIEEKKIERAGDGENFDDGKGFESDSANKLHKKVSISISPHARQIIDTFKYFFLQKFGMPPTITSKSIRELEAILSQLSLTERAAFVEKAKEAVKRYLSSKELFVEKVGYSFQTFVTTMQKYMVEDRRLRGSQQPHIKSRNQQGIVEECEF